MYSEIPETTKVTPTNHVPEIILQQQHFINTSTNPEGCHMSNFIRQNEVNKANKLLKVQQPFLEISSKMDKSRCIPWLKKMRSLQGSCKIFFQGLAR